MNITNTQADFLIKKYFQLLTTAMKSASNPTNLGLMTAGCVSDSMYAYAKELFQSYCQLLKLRDKPLYESRQKFIASLFLNEANDIVHYSQVLKGSSTCMGGNSEDDPFYDPNWKMFTYMQDGEKYSRITKDLKARFFKGTQSDWQHFGNKKCYLGTISLENISIERFNAVFKPCFDPEFFDGNNSKLTEFKANLDQLLSEIFIMEDFEESDFSKKYTHKESESNEQNLKEVMYRAGSNYNIIFADEKGKELLGYCQNIGHQSFIKKGDIVLIDNKPRSIEEIQLTDNGLGGHYATVLTSERKDLKRYFVGQI